MRLMGVRCECRRWRAAAMAALVVLAAFPAHAAKDKDKKAEPPALVPAARIEVAPLGFLAPSKAYLHMRLAWVSLNFIDKDHLLFTFHVNTLLRRTPDDSGADQMIHAAVLDIASGKVVRTADWRMYDRGQYLWALRDGKFLVRRANALYLTDSSLDLRPYLIFKTDLQGVEVSPGRTMMLLELKKKIPVAEAAEGDGGGQAPTLMDGGGTRPVAQIRTEMMLVRPGEATVLAKAEIRVPRAVPLLEDGIVSMMNGSNPNQWVLEKQTIDKTVEKLGKVRSNCTPQAQALSSDVVLATVCPSDGANVNQVVAMKVGGGVLWTQKWETRYIWPTFDYAENGSRFAYESLQANRDIGAMDSFGDADIIGQPVGVFDTKTGKLVFVTNADPILSEGQNFALSADGRRFAILRNGAIEVFDLPEVGKEKGKEEGE